MIDDKKWPPSAEDKEGPTPAELDERAAGVTEGVGGDDPEDAAGSGDPQPLGTAFRSKNTLRESR